MAPAPPPDEQRLEAYLETNPKYHPDPVPTPLDRATAIAFVNTHATLTTPPDQMRKLMRVAVFYDLHETAPTFFSLLKGGETDTASISRSAFCLIALAWVGIPAQQAGAQQYFHALQDRADPEQHRLIMLQVVEAFGPREGTGFHRQWIQEAIARYQRQMEQQQAANNISGADVAREKMQRLTEYLNIQLSLVDRTFAIRKRIDSMTPQQQIQPLVAYSLAIMSESTPALSYWASMRILRLPPELRGAIGAQFYTAPSAAPDLSGEELDLVRARALRAAQYFGYVLQPTDLHLLTTEPDTGTDPLVLRPGYYL